MLHSMLTRITEIGGRRYLQIVESFRDEAGNAFPLAQDTAQPKMVDPQ